MLSNGFWSRMPRYPAAGWIAGVCAGLSAYFDINVRLLRALVIVAAVFSHGVVLIAYGLLWYLMEKDPAVPDGGIRRRFVRRGSADPAPPRASSADPMPPSASSADLRLRFARMEERLRQMESCVSSSEYELRREFRKLES